MGLDGRRPDLDLDRLADELLDLTIDLMEFQEEMVSRLVTMRTRLTGLAERLEPWPPTE